MASEAKAQSKICLINGHFTNTLDIDDRGLVYADGLLESMLYESQQIPFLGYHLERLEKGCTVLAIPYDRECVLNQIGLLCARARNQKLQRGKIKLVVTRGAGGDGSYPERGGEANILLQFGAILKVIENDPVDLAVATSALPNTPMLAGIKHLNRLHYVMGCIGIGRLQGQEIIFFDSYGNVIETMHHNIFFVHETKLLTPKLDNCGVEGVMKRLVCEQLAMEIGMEVVEKNISIDTVADFEQAFITNAVRGIVAVKKIGKHEYSSHSVSQALNQALSDFKLK